MSDLTLTAKELTGAVPGLKTIGDRPLQAKAAYALARIKRAVQSALEDLETARVALCERYAMKDNGQSVKLPDGTYDMGMNRPAFDAEWKQLLAERVTLPGCRAVTIDEINGTPLTADELFSLGPLVIEGVGPQPPDAAK